jgi:hypothetical protein
MKYCSQIGEASAFLIRTTRGAFRAVAAAALEVAEIGGDPRWTLSLTTVRGRQPGEGSVQAMSRAAALGARTPVLEALPCRWRRAPRRWGHPLHSICSYFAMFPPQIPHVFVRWLSEIDEVVYDPFCGRGTAPLEAALAGRRAYGSDANPLAVALTAAKLDVPSARSVHARIDELERLFVAPRLSGVPADISMLYSPATLEQIVYLRDHLDPTERVDRFLKAAVLGLLHGNHSAGGATRALSVSMPNTFAMAPDYVRSYIKRQGLVAPSVDTFAMLHRRTHQLDLPNRIRSAGRAWLQDATQTVPPWFKRQQVKLVFTSPPYLDRITYGKYNWIRLWFLGQEPKAVDAALTTTAEKGGS